MSEFNGLLYSNESIILQRAFQAARDRGGRAEPRFVVKRALRLSGKAPDFSPAICDAILARDAAFRCIDNQWFIKTIFDFERPISQCDLTVLDFEATGGKPPDDRITEVAMVRVRNGEVIDEFSTLVNPERQIPPYVVRLIGITDRMVEGEPSFEEIISQVLDFIKGSLLVVHNVSGDLPFLDHECQRLYGGIISLPVIDTQHLALKFIPDLGGLGLERLADHFGVELTDRHRAMGDVITTSKILERFLAIVGDKMPREIFSDECRSAAPPEC